MKKYTSFNEFLIISALTEPYTAGGGKHALSYAKFLANNESRVTILSLNIDPSVLENEIIDAVRIIRYPYYHTAFILKYLQIIRYVPSLICQIWSHKIIIIYGRYFPLFPVAIVAGRLFNKTVIFRSTILFEDDISSLLRGSVLKQITMKLVFKMITLYHAITPEFSRIYLQHFRSKNKLFESPQGVDTNKFFELSNKKKEDMKSKFNNHGNNLILLTLGSLIDRKGYLPVFRVLKDLHIPFIYYVAGESNTSSSPHLSDKQDQMIDIINEGNELLGDRINFLGYQKDITALLQIADVMIINSIHEGLPNSLLEAIAVKCLPVVRNISGIKDYIIFHGKNGYLFNNPEEVSDILERIYNEKLLKGHVKALITKDINHVLSFNYIHRELMNKLQLAKNQ